MRGLGGLQASQASEKKKVGIRGIAKSPWEAGAPKIPVIGEQGSGIAVTRVIVNTTMLLSVREKRIGTVAPPPR